MPFTPRRGLLALMTTLVLALGATTLGAGPARAAASAPPTTTPTGACAAPYGLFVASLRSHDAKAQEVRRDARRVERAQARADEATNPGRVRSAEARLKRAEAAERRHQRQQARLEKRAVQQYGAWQACETEEEPTDPTDPETASAIQTLCDNGLPQEVCDTFSDLPLPAPGEAGPSPIQALCDAGAPQALCDAATLVGAGGRTVLQPLCDLGLPQVVCDLSSGGSASPLPLPIDPGDPLGSVCELVAVPGLCDASDPTDPLDVLDPVLTPLCGLLPIPVLCP